MTLQPTNPIPLSMSTNRPLILGSTSVYRKTLLTRLGLPFDVIAPSVDETPQTGEAPKALALRLALAKAADVSKEHPLAVVIGCDQVADLDGKPLGKPGSHERAFSQLMGMSGRVVLFHTAVAVVCQATAFARVEIAQVSVKFRALTPSEIEAYLIIEQPYDCAGSAKSEGLGVALVDQIDNDDPTALVGLPMIRTCRLLREAGMTLLT